MDRVETGAELRISLMKAKGMTEEFFVDLLKKLTTDAFRELVNRSATDTGYLRSKWSVTKLEPMEGALSNPYPSAKAKGLPPYFKAPKTPVIEVRAGDIIVLYNNTEYAIHLETGTPNMAAQPMVQPTYQMLKATADMLAEQLSRRKLNV